MLKYILLTLAILFASSTIQAGDYFAVHGCHRGHRAAKRDARRYGGYVVNTNNYPNFSSGYYCAVHGPGSYRRMKNVCSRYSQCYVKSGY